MSRDNTNLWAKIPGDLAGKNIHTFQMFNIESISDKNITVSLVNSTTSFNQVIEYDNFDFSNTKVFSFLIQGRGRSVS
jgi:hypothetical protein